ncbi:MAG: DEAD/DEAH box helicase [Bowdeniella nasicola]|nr:DEAD/DEAH box helicase [Bowdeniella nasicola]
MTTYSPGALVAARGREWVVEPESSEDFLVLRPLAGAGLDRAGIFPALEEVTSAAFPPPSEHDLGNHRSIALLRDALRIGFRHTGGPLRSLAGLAVTPRPYQYVPLLVALRHDVVRLLIADDVGIGKTIESGLIAAELLAEGAISRLSVLCPPALAEQWQAELAEKFGIEAELVLSSTVRKLQRSVGYDESLFRHYPFTIVSTDFIKDASRRDEFVAQAPELVIIDEAHTCVGGDGTATSKRGRSKAASERYRLVKALAADPNRHLICATATPHSGDDDSFNNLIGLLEPSLPELDLSQREGRQRLADYMVQRRRGDIRHFLDAETSFPTDRLTRDVSYRMTPPMRDLFDEAVAFARGQLGIPAEGVAGDEPVSEHLVSQVKSRGLRWWSALALLRCVASSPAAATAALRTRVAGMGEDGQAEAVTADRPRVYDVSDLEHADDVLPSAVPTDADERERAYLANLADRFEALAREEDAKLATLVREVRSLHKKKSQPIVFCRYMATAHYVAQALAEALPRVTVEVVTGELPPSDRAERVATMVRESGTKNRVLVATDCLAEGINLQEGFQAVVHYDLAWTPTRHEQREGRVDRFGQTASEVRSVSIFGEDNGIDGIVMEVLIQKHREIRKTLGVAVPVPDGASERVLEAMLEGQLLRGADAQETLDDELFASVATPYWESLQKAERRSQTFYAQASVRAEEIAPLIDSAVNRAGSPGDVAAFVIAALKETGAAVSVRDEDGATTVEVDSAELPVGLREALGAGSAERLRFTSAAPAPRGYASLVRTDPRVAGLARYVLDTALMPPGEGERLASRAAVVKTADVTEPTIALLARFRMAVELPTTDPDNPERQIAEEARVLAFTGLPSEPAWLDDEQAAALLAARPSGNVAGAEDLMATITGAIASHADAMLNEHARQIAEELRAEHARVRRVARGSGLAGRTRVREISVEPKLPPDILGIVFYLPGEPS